MEMAILKRKKLSLSYNRMRLVLILIFTLLGKLIYSQCLSSANPIGGTNNLLVLEKKTFRFISFHKFNYGNQHHEENKRSDFDLIKSANYNYLGTILGFGISDKFTLETETGYFINKTQIYNVTPAYQLRGYGFSNIIISGKYGFITNHFKRLYYSASTGIKIPSSTKPKSSNGVELPEEVQPTIGSYGMVIQSFLVKENSGKGLRFFLTNRFESNLPNEKEFQLGTSVVTSVFISKHLMYSWIKGDWTVILQMRNEIRFKNKRDNQIIESSGGVIFILSPQLNYSLKEKWNVSLMADVPIYQYLYGIQLATKFGITIGFARDFEL